MRFNNYEMKKLFDFILINKNIVLSDYGLFSRDTLIMLRDIIKEKRPNDFELSKKQENALINAFLTGNSIFDEDTPSFILLNPDCINVAIERDPSSANFVSDFTPELEEKTLQLALKHKYILKINSPAFLKNNYAIALNSIRENPSSADYVDWDSMTKEDKDDLLEETIKSGYVLSSSSCQTLKENPDVILSSISKNIKTICYADSSAKDNPKVFKYLIMNNHEFSKRELERHPLSSYADPDIMKYALHRFGILNKEDDDFTDCFEEYPDDIDKYIDRYSSLFANAVKTIPTISSFKGIFQYSAEAGWEEYREENLDELANIFGKICAELQTNNDYSDAIDNLDFLSNMQEVLDERYNLLLQAMEQYHTIIHSRQQLGNMDYARDQIAKLSALYVSISKENYKKEQLEEYEELIKGCFIPRKDHPTVYKKIIEHKYKDAIKELYDRKDKDIFDFLKGVVKQYTESVDEDTLWEMIENFISDGYSKMDQFIKAPRGFNNYKRYEESCKLVNRLNSKYIKYTDQELVRYLDIIKYDINSDKYYYAGPTFEEEQINRYNEYRKKQRIFEKIKQQIIFKARTLKINEKISSDELDELAEELPFTDEYFEFDKSYYERHFDFEDFMNSCIVDNDIIEPSSLIDDEAYSVLNNYVINNGLIWILLLLNSEGNDELEEQFDKDSLLATMDSMKDIVRLSKKFNYDINKYTDICSLQDLSQCADDESIAILGKEIIEKLCSDQRYTDNDSKKILGIAKDLICEMSKRNQSTVPYVKGKTANYQYSLYDSQDETLLLAGINTSACFRVDGVDNDFLHYCALNKNGFVIKITDNFGNFIGRASGFRNGNCIYINQLRTIYDEGGDGYEGSYDNEKQEIIDTFQKACNDIVETSQQNKEEKDKIDFVFVTQSYAMSNVESNVGRDVVNKIGSKPMICNSEDWKNFVRKTKHLRDCSIDGGFTTDYGNYSLICMASSKIFSIFGKMRAKDIKPKDVDAVYTRPRNNIIATDKPNLDVINKVNRINGIYSYLHNTEFESITISNGTVLFTGDNWYIAYSNGAISSSRVLDFDRKAQIECEATKRTIQEYINHNQQFNVEQVSQQLETQNPDGCVRVLRLTPNNR